MKELVTIFKGVSDPIRLRMVGLLLQHDELCVCDLMAALQLPQSTTSRHLSYLRRCGWLISRQEGLWRYYRLSTDLCTRYADLLDMLEKRLNSSKTMNDTNALLDEFVKAKRIC